MNELGGSDRRWDRKALQYCGRLREHFQEIGMIERFFKKGMSILTCLEC